MSPDQFSHSAQAWITALSGLVAPVTMFVGSLLGIFAYVKSRLNETRINGHSETLQKVLLNTPAPGQSAAVNVNAAPPSDINIDAGGVGSPANSQRPIAGDPGANTDVLGAPLPAPGGLPNIPGPAPDEKSLDHQDAIPHDSE